jgi:hypothetical protein
MPPKRSASDPKLAGKKAKSGTNGNVSVSNAASNSFLRGGFEINNVGWMAEDQAGRKATSGFLLRREEVFKMILSMTLSKIYSVATNKRAESQITIDIRGEKIANTFTCDHGTTFIRKEPYHFTCVYSTDVMECTRISNFFEGIGKDTAYEPNRCFYIHFGMEANMNPLTIYKIVIDACKQAIEDQTYNIENRPNGKLTVEFIRVSSFERGKRILHGSNGC